MILSNPEYPCGVNERGYQWVRPDSSKAAKTERYLVERTEGEVILNANMRQGHIAFYNPLSIETLFLRFANLAPNEKEILSFANEYGFLGLCKIIAVGGDEMEGEALSDWQREIVRLEEAEQLRMAIQIDDTDSLAEKIEIQQSKDGIYCSLKSKAFPAKRKIIIPDSALFKMAKMGDYAIIATSFLKDLVNQLPATHRSGILALSGDEKLKMKLQPSSLLAALWTQFASAIENDTHFRRCLKCGKWFGVPFGFERGKPRLYCSNACNVKAYRERKQQGGK